MKTKLLRKIRKRYLIFFVNIERIKVITKSGDLVASSADIPFIIERILNHMENEGLRRKYEIRQIRRKNLLDYKQSKLKL